ncbi:MAG: hypothetical protein ACYDDI_16780 [Candidatus Acidiferrales bacterium]
MRTPSENLNQLKTQIEAVILRESEDFFADPKDLAVLRVTIRIACEFFDFLERTDDPLEESEAEYMAGTIRSGMDFFFTLAQWGGMLSGLELRTGFGQKLPSTFSEMKVSYGSVLRQLIQCKSSATGMGMLLFLAQTMLLFMTIYFPSPKLADD